MNYHALPSESAETFAIAAAFRESRGVVDQQAYPDVIEFFAHLVSRVYREEIAALGESGCTYLRIDDTNLAYLCDPKMRDNARRSVNIPKNCRALMPAWSTNV
jgi:methionine synthase II (cobalamin-independent)